ncbi:MAG: protein kinase [Pirellulaceae bacterium]
METGLTASGAALGTPSYMSPEQAAGRIEEQHQATDIYSLGAVLFTLVTGQPPFKGNGVVQTIMHVIHRPAPMARTLRSDLPADLETIIDVCLQKSPERRYPSAGALADDLNRFLSGGSIVARPASPHTTQLVLVVRNSHHRCSAGQSCHRAYRNPSLGPTRIDLRGDSMPDGMVVGADPIVGLDLQSHAPCSTRGRWSRRRKL